MKTLLKDKRKLEELERQKKLEELERKKKELEEFKKLVDDLKSVKQIDYILLLLSFGERLTNNTKEYINKLSNIFTPMKFYNHISIIFTKSPEISKEISKKMLKNIKLLKKK